MEKQDSRLKKQDIIIVYACPFCMCSVWFSKIQDLCKHLYDNHLSESLFNIAGLNLIQITKTKSRWLECK